jgi:general secretion pathway protein D
MKKHAWALLAIALSLWGCASFVSNYFKLGNQAESNKDWDKAIQFYEKAVLEKPNEYVYKMALARVRMTATMIHLRAARQLAVQGKKEEALKEYEAALTYDPRNRALAEEMRRLAEEGPPEPVAVEEKIENPVKLKVAKDKLELKFTDASLRSIFQALAKHAQVNIIFDELFKDVPMTIDITGRQFEEAVSYLCLASKNFYRIIDEKSLIIVPDQPVKRIQYEQNAIKVFYLSNISAQDIFAALQQMLRSQIRAPNIFVDKNLNTVTIRDTPTNINLAAQLIRRWDKTKGEVVVDVEIMEVSRQRLRQIGVDLDSAIVGLRYVGRGTAEGQESTGWYNMGDLKLGNASSYEVSLPTALIDFLQSDADTKVLAQPRLRGVGDEEMRTLVGQKVPIPQTTFTPIAAGGVSQQPITSFAYQDVGLEVKIKPKIHLEKEITLEIEIKTTSIVGSGYADIPIIATREIKNIIRLKDGETNLLAGLLRDEERKALHGIAGLAGIPILGNLFGATEQRVEQSDLIMTVTPYIVRAVPRTAEDNKALWIQLEGISTGGPPGRAEEEAGAEEMAAEEEIPPEFQAEEAAAEEQPEEEPGESQVSLDPADFEVPRGREFRISVNLRSGQEIGNISLSISFNPQVSKLKEVLEGGIIRMAGARIPFLKSIADGSCTIGFSSPQLSQGVKGGGNMATLIFEALAPGESRIMVTSVSANSPSGQPISFASRESRVVVR